MPETNLREVVARIAKLVKGLPERVLSVEKGYAQLATELSELKERLDISPDPSDSSDFKALSRDDVVKIDNEDPRMFLENTTFQLEEWLEALHEILQEKADKNYSGEWVRGDIEGQVLLASGGGWRSGKLRLSMEFLPETEETKD
ncbi:MAG: hypothetical protein F6J93_25755 [Oscillatoria sp. SIO1A7]|nr:hypothetical protein [Oscillatoria sp. SIO1A7]